MEQPQPERLERTQIQERINYVNELYRTNKSKDFDIYKLNIVHSEFGEYIPGRDNTSEKLVFLASTSKVVITKLFKSIFTEDEYGIKIPVSDWKNILGELFNRDQLQKEFDKEMDVFIDIIQIILNDFTPINTYQDFLLKFQQLSSRKFTDEDWIHIPLDILINLSLSASANIPVEIMRREIVKNIGHENYIRGLKRIAINYSPTISSANFQHWIQPDANIGKLSEIAGVLHELVESEDDLIHNTSSDDYDFKFDFKNSETGKRLLEQGYKIYEKTGSYCPVNWVSRLAEEGFPIHMAMCSIVTIVPPKGKIRTFYKTLNIEMPWIEEESDYNGVKFKAVESSQYNKISDTVKLKVSPDFRAEFEQEIIESLAT